MSGRPAQDDQPTQPGRPVPGQPMPGSGAHQAPGGSTGSYPAAGTGQYQGHAAAGAHAGNGFGNGAGNGFGNGYGADGVNADGADGDGYTGSNGSDGSGGGSKSGKGLGALGIAALMLGSAAVGGATGAIVTNNSGSSTEAEGSSDVTNALEEPGAERSDPAPAGSTEAAAQAALDSVVSIQVTSPQGAGSGSGSILSSDGLVLTNQHVAAGAEQPGTRMTVLLNDGTTHPARYVAGHGPSDIAVIQIEGVNDLRPISLGDSSKVAVGQEVVAVGSPLGLTSTVTSGIVSAINRPVGVSGEGGESSVIDAIQTDAAINPGNSGGALVDMEGNLIGVPSVIASNGGAGQQAGSIGLGFAIPVNQARRIADDLIDDGSVEMPAINAAINTRAPVPGALVGDVTPGGAAERAGLRPGDVIVKVDERRVDSGVALIAAIRSREVGDTVTLTVTDEEGGESRTLDVTLEAARE
ncbi:S1C family serine protease [uncultured Corynebacterium sp.]|uniref:S1C family serine protease n=1 Tax=uncultured Corynebacterium sp. TaxID=159447 RepID=UPI0025DA3FB4|nr:trypsin-like peptidase domain-containing protein [uncultured Corynebacterium sp.]